MIDMPKTAAKNTPHMEHEKRKHSKKIKQQISIQKRERKSDQQQIGTNKANIENILRILRNIKRKNSREEKHTIMINNNAWYYILPDIFKFLEVHELLRVAQVCRMWRDSAVDPSLWKTVHLKNCQVTDWKALTNTLQRLGTQNLDLRGMSTANKSNNWNKLLIAISKMTSLVKLELCECSTMLVEQIIESCPQLQILNAMSIESGSLNLKSIDNLNHCRELRLRPKLCSKKLSYMRKLVILKDLTPLQNLTQLTHLSLTSIDNNFQAKIFDTIQVLTKLETLELGPCYDWTKNFGTTVLQKLKNLKRLRLEQIGYKIFDIFDIFGEISKLKDLNHVELTGCDLTCCRTTYRCLADCKNIKQLLITSSHLIKSRHLLELLEIIQELSNTLTHFVFGVPAHCNRSEIFCDINKQNNEEFISSSHLHLFKNIEGGIENLIAKDNMRRPIADYYYKNNLPPLQKLLLTVLPKSRITIVKQSTHYFQPRISDIVT